MNIEIRWSFNGELHVARVTTATGASAVAFGHTRAEALDVAVHEVCWQTGALPRPYADANLQAWAARYAA